MRLHPETEAKAQPYHALVHRPFGLVTGPTGSGKITTLYTAINTLTPYLVSSAVSGVLAQRLVRAISPACKTLYYAAAPLKEQLTQRGSTTSSRRSPLVKGMCIGDGTVIAQPPEA